MSETFKIEVEVDLSKYLTDHAGYSDEDGPVLMPTTLASIIVEQAARSVAHDAMAGRDAKQEVREAVAAIIYAEAQEKVRPLIEEALSGGIMRDSFDPNGERVPLAKYIVELAQGQLKVDSRDSFNRTWFQDLLRAEVEGIVKKELKAEIDEAKANVRQAIKEQGAEFLADAALKVNA